MLVYMSRENIRELKRLAIAGGPPAYVIIIEELVEAWLKKRRKQKECSAPVGVEPLARRKHGPQVRIRNPNRSIA